MKKPLIVKDGILEGKDILVNSNDWFVWLADPKVMSFRFDDGTDAYTCRKEIVRDTPYWYGYRKLGGKLVKRYLGKADDLSLCRLIEAGSSFHKPSEKKLNKVIGKLINHTEFGPYELNELGHLRQEINEMRKHISEQDKRIKELQQQIKLMQKNTEK